MNHHNQLSNNRSISIDYMNHRSDDIIIKAKSARLRDQILLSPVVKYVIPTFVIVAVLMTSVYVTIYIIFGNGNEDWPATCDVRVSYRIDCFPGKINVSECECKEAQCCFDDETKLCFHSIPSSHGYTQRDSDNYEENQILVPRKSSSPLGSRNAESLTLKIRDVDANHVQLIFEINDGHLKTNNRVVTDDSYQQFLNFLPFNPKRKILNLRTDSESNLKVFVSLPEFSVTVLRKNGTDYDPVLTTARGPMILTKTFWEWSLYLTNSSLYGLNQLELGDTINWIYDDENGKTVPGFLGINDDGQGMLCYIDYKGPMEIKVINESNLAVIRGMSLPTKMSIHVFAGPTPLEAVQQLTQFFLRETNFGKKSKISHSSLGVQICPNNENDDYVTSIRNIVDQMTKADAPWDTHCINQNFQPTFGNIFDEKLKNIVLEATNLIGESRFIVPHLSPMVFAEKNNFFQNLSDSKLLLKKLSDNYVGFYKNRQVVYPDWMEEKTHEKSVSYLNDYLNEFPNSELIFLRDTWPKDETPINSMIDHSKFDYLPEGLEKLMTKTTIPYDLLPGNGTKQHFVDHNAYSENFRNFIEKIIGNSVEKIQMTEEIWDESKVTSWLTLRAIITRGVGSCLVGQIPQPMYVCGSENVDKNKNDQLCSRWYGAAVPWPHVLANPKNLPGSDSLSSTTGKYATKHLKYRASLVTYARTTLANYYANGSPIFSPTSLHFSTDIGARKKWNQFMWGESILVGLVTLPGVSQIPMWIPGRCPWRHLQDGVEVEPTKSGVTPVTSVEGIVVTLVRPGHIIPVHEEISSSVETTSRNYLKLVVNFGCEEFDEKTKDCNCLASGKILYGEGVGNGDFLKIIANQTHLRLDNVIAVVSKLCNVIGSKIERQQTSLIKYVTFLGSSIVYDVGIDLCTLENGDTFEKLFVNEN